MSQKFSELQNEILEIKSLLHHLILDLSQKMEALQEEKQALTKMLSNSFRAHGMSHLEIVHDKDCMHSSDKGSE